MGDDNILKLLQPTPVLEEGDASDLAAWHLVRDAVYGYAVAYPPNWWTNASKGARFLTPDRAGQGGVRHALRPTGLTFASKATRTG